MQSTPTAEQAQGRFACSDWSFVPEAFRDEVAFGAFDELPTPVSERAQSFAIGSGTEHMVQPICQRRRLQRRARALPCPKLQCVAHPANDPM